MLAIQRAEPIAHVNRVLVAVCTYKRPKMLEACLASLMGQELRANFRFEVCVIDNDAKGSGHQTFIKSGRFGEVKTHYVSEAKRGISFARNAAIKYALDLGFDYLAFIDDDGIAHHGWLAGLMHIDYLHIPILGGQRVMTFNGIPDWARPCKKRNPPLEGQSINHAYTNNVRYNAAVLEAGIRFDESIGLGIGEDVVFCQDAKKAGFGIKYTARALTWEAAHLERYTVSKLAERAYAERITTTKRKIAKRGRFSVALSTVFPFIMSGPKTLGYFVACGASYPFSELHARKMFLKAYLQMANALGRYHGLKGYTATFYQHVAGE